MENFNKGDIWEIETTNGTVREVLLVQCFEDYAATLTLLDYKPEHTYMAIKSQGLKYADCGRLGYIFYDKATKFIRQLSDEELNEVQCHIVGALDLPVQEEVAADPVSDECDNATQPQEADTSADDSEEVKTLLMDSTLELQKVTSERDVYKELYNQLLGKLL